MNASKPVEQPAEQPKSRRARWPLIAAAVAVVTPLLIILGGATALSFPHPGRAGKVYSTPADHGLQVTQVQIDRTPAWWFPNPDAEHAILVCHGRSRNRSWMLPMIARLAPTYSVLAIEFPHHGDDGWGLSSVGPREAADVHRGIDFLEAQGEDSIGVYGISMGGAAAVFALSGLHRDSVKGLVTDGTYARLSEVASSNAERFGLPTVLLSPTLAVAGWMNDMRYSEVNPEEQAAHLKMPFLAIHGAHDPLAPTTSAARLAAANPDLGQSFLYPGGHDEPFNPLVGELVEAFFQQLTSE